MRIIPTSRAPAFKAALTWSLWSMLPPAAPAATPPGDACSLFTATEVSGVLGVTVPDGQHPIASSLLLCGWAPSGDPQIGGKHLLVSLMTERAFEVGKTPQQGIVKTPVSDVGDDAYYVSAGGLGTALSIKKGGTYVQIRIGGFPARKEKELEKALAVQMLARL